MRAKAGFYLPAVLLLMLGLAGPLQAQTGTLTGTVTDAETGAPISDVAVEIMGAEQTQAGGEYTNQAGQFRITLAPGTYSVVFSMLGYASRRVDGVRITAGGSESIDVALTSRAFRLNPIVVTASRREEKALESPTSISIVNAEIVRERPAITPVEHVKALPGVDVVQTGVQASNIVTRGFNNVFSGALLVLTDNRYAHVPSLRFNAYNMIPSNDLDLDRIEVSLGPGAALYGPNSASGVMHLITKSPLDDQGTSVQIGTGIRSGNDVNSESAGIFHTAFRSAHKLSDQVGFKISGQYFTGTDWEFVDALEQTAVEAGTGFERDYSSERWSGEARLDYRFDDDKELILSGGMSTIGKSIEMTGLGAAQADGWQYKYLQGRFKAGRLFAQAFLNMS
ncbi:MAG: carboxypeptidase regulatory-like domain-containing protein, partial [Gemmatimonadetes bacterium]|nr:carboxypeptidase regulatory-like domain-containing protein [Gemmatimonadota bacterium]